MARSSSIHSTAAAPSEICELLPAVWMPSGMTGLSLAEALLGGLPQALVPADDLLLAGRVALAVDDGTSMGATSRSKRPSAQAWAALRWDSAPSQSTSSRVMPRFWAMRSAAPNWSGMSQGKLSGLEEPGPLKTLAPRPTRLMASTPQEMPMSMASTTIRLLMKWLACWAEPHWQSTVVAADSYGQPGAQPGVAGDVGGLLAGLGDAAPDDLLDRSGVDARLLDQLDLRGGEQLGGVEARQPAVALADRRPDGFDDDRLTHVLLPGRWQRRRAPILESF